MSILHWMINAYRKTTLEKMEMAGFVFSTEKWTPIHGQIYIFSKVMKFSKFDWSFRSDHYACFSLWISTTVLLPSVILQLRLIQDSPIRHRSPWSIDEFYLFHTHASLQWLASKDPLNSTFLTLSNQSNDEILYQTKDVYFHSHSIMQMEYNDTDLHNHPVEYSIDLGLTWMTVSDENHLTFVPVEFQQENMTFYRLTINLNVFSIIRFRFRCRANHLLYIYLGHPCLMNCYGAARCTNGQCQINNPVIPLVCHYIDGWGWCKWEYLGGFSRNIWKRFSRYELVTVGRISARYESDILDNCKTASYHQTDWFKTHTVLTSIEDN